MNTQQKVTASQEAPGQARNDTKNELAIQDAIEASYADRYSSKFIEELANSTQALGCELVMRGEIEKGIEFIDFGMVLYSAAIQASSGEPRDVRNKATLFQMVQEVLPDLYERDRLTFNIDLPYYREQMKS